MTRLLIIKGENAGVKGFLGFFPGLVKIPPSKFPLGRVVVGQRRCRIAPFSALVMKLYPAKLLNIESGPRTSARRGLRFQGKYDILKEIFMSAIRAVYTSFLAKRMPAGGIPAEMKQ